jgi:hypothetical protein
MGSSHHISYNLDEKFSLAAKMKKNIMYLMIFGVVFIALGFIFDSTGKHHEGATEEHHSSLKTTEQVLLASEGEHAVAVPSADEHTAEVEHHEPTVMTRLFANLLINGVYLAWMALAGLMFYVIQYVADAGWSSGFKRVPEAFSGVLPFAGAILFVIIAAGLFSHELYGHWAAEGLATEGSANYDKIIAGKSAWLNVPFFLLRIVAFFTIWSLFRELFRKFSLKEDMEPAPTTLWWDKTVWWGCLYLGLFAVSFCLSSIDWIMSLEAHWFSTMFGFYNIASMWVSGIAAMTLVIMYLRSQGYLGKLVFGFSIFWTYIWLGQFLLIWYANLPEEVVYFYKRWTPEYKFMFWCNLVINWLLPMLILMARDMKRNLNVLKTVCVIIILGHWFDLYMMIMPGTMGQYRTIGFMEIGTFALFIGIFLSLMFRSLSKAKLVGKNHPYLEESLHHEVA